MVKMLTLRTNEEYADRRKPKRLQCLAEKAKEIEDLLFAHEAAHENGLLLPLREVTVAMDP